MTDVRTTEDAVHPQEIGTEAATEGNSSGVETDKTTATLIKVTNAVKLETTKTSKSHGSQADRPLKPFLRGLLGATHLFFPISTLI